MKKKQTKKTVVKVALVDNIILDLSSGEAHVVHPDDAAREIQNHLDDMKHMGMYEYNDTIANVILLGRYTDGTISQVNWRAVPQQIVIE